MKLIKKLIVLAAVCAGAYFLFNRLFAFFVVDTGEMGPEFNPGEFVLVAKPWYKVFPPTKGDFVCSLRVSKPGQCVAKIYAVAGDNILIKEHLLNINDERPEYPDIAMDDDMFSLENATFFVKTFKGYEGPKGIHTTDLLYGKIIFKLDEKNKLYPYIKKYLLKEAY